MAEAADREDHATRFREGRVDVPAEGAEVLAGDGGVGGGEERILNLAGAAGGWVSALRCYGGEVGGDELLEVGAGLLGLRHELERGLFEGEGAGVAEKFVEEGLGVERDVMGGGEEAGVPGYASHAAGGGVVDGAAEKMIEVRVGGGVGCGLVVVGGGGDGKENFIHPPTGHVFTCSCPPSPAHEDGSESRSTPKMLVLPTSAVVGKVAGLCHAEWCVDVFADVVVLALSG